MEKVSNFWGTFQFFLRLIDEDGFLNYVDFKIIAILKIYFHINFEKILFYDILNNI